MTNEVYFPFNIGLIEKNGSNYKFEVNGGDINSIIFSTYRATFSNYNDFLPPAQDSSLANKNPYYPRNSLGNPLFDFNENLDEKIKDERTTFTINETCDIYLTIPKVPAGFEDYSFSKASWFYGLAPYAFLNEFSIVTSIDEGFDDQYLKNTLSKGGTGDIETLSSSEFIYLKNEDYPGRIYIKIANIQIKNSEVFINYFFRSNVIAPLRYMSLGNLRMRNLKIIYTIISQTQKEAAIPKQETITIKGVKDDPTTELDEYIPDETFVDNLPKAKIFVPILGMGEETYTFNSPYLFNKPINEIKTLCKSSIESRINFLFTNYYADRIIGTLSGTTGAFASSFGLRVKKENLKIVQIIFIYKESTNGKLIVENLFEDVKSYNSLKKLINDTNAKAYKGLGLEDSAPEDMEDKKPMTKSEAYSFLKLNEEMAEYKEGKISNFVDLKLEETVQLIGFAEG
jgi:hypothetical protein